MEHNPWETKTTETVFKSAWIEVEKHDVINPSGNPGLYGLVRFKNIAIGVVPLDNEYNTWLVGQWRYPINAYSWEIPEGGGPLEIDPLESAKRELKEETGIIAEEFTELIRLYLSNSATDELAIVFVAKKLHFESAEPEDTELLQIKKININEAYKWVMEGKITDAISVAAILKTHLLIQQGQL